MKWTYFLFVFGLLACQEPESDSTAIQEGDILFLNEAESALGKAIDGVTSVIDSFHFFHMGIATLREEAVWVYHASSEKGVVLEPLDSFAKRKNGLTYPVYQFRLKPEYQGTIPRALKKAETYLGQPYNFTYIPTDTGLYCSQYIYLLFESDSIFHMNPMSFTVPGTDSIPQAWLDHYAELGKAIPEGLPGCNPNGMAAEKVLEYIAIHP